MKMRKAIRSGSPIYFAEGFRGRLLIIHGSGDDNVPYPGTEKLADLHASVLALPRIQPGGAHAQVPRHVGGLASALHLLDRRDEPSLRCAGSFHLEFPFSKLENSSLGRQSFRGQVIGDLPLFSLPIETRIALG